MGRGRREPRPPAPSGRRDDLATGCEPRGRKLRPPKLSREEKPHTTARANGHNGRSTSRPGPSSRPPTPRGRSPGFPGGIARRVGVGSPAGERPRGRPYPPQESRHRAHGLAPSGFCARSLHTFDPAPPSASAGGKGGLEDERPPRADRPPRRRARPRFHPKRVATHGLRSKVGGGAKPPAARGARDDGVFLGGCRVNCAPPGGLELLGSDEEPSAAGEPSGESRPAARLSYESL